MLLLVLCMSALSACHGTVRGLFPPAPGEPTETIFVVNHGWHTDLVVPAADLPSTITAGWEAAGTAKYIEIGRGEDAFYRAEKLTSTIVARAVFWRNPAALRVMAIAEEPDDAFPGCGILRIEVGREGLLNLRDYLAASFATDGAGRPIMVEEEGDGSGRFYRATGSYYFPDTCNKWTARGLRATGAPITPFYALRARNVFSQASKFGVVVREFAED